MKIIFLDIDGVLNYTECWVKPEHKNKGCLKWDANCVKQLNRIIQETGAKIVVSSTWRLINYDYYVLTKEMDIEGEFIGKTINLGDDGTRGDEIKDWLNNNEVNQFIIVDDDPDNEMGDLKEYLIQPIGVIDGLTKKLADKAIEKLKGK